jgi:ribosomal protein L11 methyltransferase
LSLVAFRVHVRADREDLATGALWAAGTRGVEVQAGVRGETVLVAYFDEREGLFGELERELSAASPAVVHPIPVPDVDWVARFRAGFRAFDAAGFRIVPAWEAAPSAPAQRIVVDPGRAFGTGTHETTRLCLGLLRERAAERALGRVLDLGAGTAILGIAASRLGASLVVASDDDPEAVSCACAHARLNAAPIHVVRADGGRAFAPGAFDLVVANLTAPLLLERRDEVARLRSPAGVLILSGLLRDDLAEVSAAYSDVGRAAAHEDGEWAALRVDPR